MLKIIELSETSYSRYHSPKIKRKKGCYALAALIISLTPKIET